MRNKIAAVLLTLGLLGGSAAIAAETVGGDVMADTQWGG